VRNSQSESEAECRESQHGREKTGRASARPARKSQPLAFAFAFAASHCACVISRYPLPLQEF